MSAYNPRIDFFRIQLVHKSDEFKTFKDFIIEVLNKSKVHSDTQLLQFLTDDMISLLQSDMAVDDHIKKQVRWINKKANLYKDFKPNADISNFIIHGVLSGGRYGRNGIITDRDITEEESSASSLNPDKAIHKYSYFMLYTPFDHNEGVLMVHSNSRDESITDIMKTFFTKFFKRGDYKKPVLMRFCPLYLQNQFTQRSFLKQINLKTSYVEDSINKIGIQNGITNYNIQILITPRQGEDHHHFSIDDAKELMTKFALHHNLKGQQLFSKFGTRQVTMEDEHSKHVQTFEMDKDDVDLCPVIDVRNVLPDDSDYQRDGTPRFDRLHDVLLNVLHEEIIPELRRGL